MTCLRSIKCNVTFCFDVFPQSKPIEGLHEESNVYSCLFCVKTSSKEEGMITLSRTLRWRLNGGVYMPISRTTSKSAFGEHLLFEFPEKDLHNLKDETVSYQK